VGSAVTVSISGPESRSPYCRKGLKNDDND